MNGRQENETGRLSNCDDEWRGEYLREGKEDHVRKEKKKPNEGDGGKKK